MNCWSLRDLGPFRHSPLDLADRLFFRALSDKSRRAVVQATGTLNKLAIVFMIPEFQRR
jgi:hypothetical protein